MRKDLQSHVSSIMLGYWQGDGKKDLKLVYSVVNKEVAAPPVDSIEAKWGE